MADFLDVADALLGSGKTGVSSSYFEEVFNARAALNVAQSKATIDLDNLESVFSVFEMAALIKSLGDWEPERIIKLPSAMRQLIVGTLENTIKFPVKDKKLTAPQPYDRFTKVVKSIGASDKEPCTIMTFNYDIGLDYALFFNRVPYDYCLHSPPPVNTVKLLKLHGSLNWGRDKKTDKVLAWEFDQFFKIGYFDLSDPELQFVDFAISSHFHKWKGAGDGMYSDPVIIPPTWSKMGTYGSINNVWATAAQELTSAEQIIVIGYSLPITDEFFRYLYALGTISSTRIKKFLVYNPDTTGTVESRFRDLLGQSSIKRFNYQCTGFSEALDRLDRDIN